MSVDATRDKVQRILTKNLNSVEIDGDGGYRVRYGSTLCAISVREFGEDDSVVSLTSPILMGVKPTDEVYRWVATEGQTYIFGSALVWPDEDGTVTIGFDHALLGTFLDEDELMHALVAVVTTADRLDDELKDRFGGERWQD